MDERKISNIHSRKEKDGISYTLFLSPLQLLNFTYPNEDYDKTKTKKLIYYMETKD